MSTQDLTNFDSLVNQFFDIDPKAHKLLDEKNKAERMLFDHLLQACNKLGDDYSFDVN